MNKWSGFLYALVITFLALAVYGVSESRRVEIRGALPVKLVADAGALSAISGATTDRFVVNKFGQNGDVDAAEDIIVAGGDYAGFPTTGSAEALEVLSSDADDADSGSGCEAVRIFGHDANYDLIQEDVTLAGATPQDTTQTFWRVNRAYCLTAGASGNNEGTITIRHTTTTANVFATIAAGVGQTEQLVYTVPDGYTCYLQNYQIGLSDTSANTASVSFWIRPEDGAFRLINDFLVRTTATFQSAMSSSASFGERTDIKVRVTDIQNVNGLAVGTFQLICIEE
jgi:hypothetical protein